MSIKRLLDCTAFDFEKMTGKELKQAMLASEGRTIVAEVIGSFTPYYSIVVRGKRHTYVRMATFILR